MKRHLANHSSGILPRRAAAAAELALALPILLLLAFGCADLGRAVASYLAVSNAARVGAEYGATHGFTTYTYSSWQSQVTQRAQAEAQGSVAFDPSRLTVTVSTVAGSGNFYQVTVAASYPFSTISAWPGLPDNFNLTHSVTMQRFR